MFAFDSSTSADALDHAGGDTRQWISYGIVEVDTADAHSVRFNDDDGSPLPQGVLVTVTLQPSGITVTCRVGSQNGGSGEGEYSPFGPGDEVLVAIPEGDERAGCVIISRLSNVHDAMPQAVAGMDVTNNSITFRRLVTPYVLETSGSYAIRHALTGATMSIDPAGAIMLADGEGNTFGLNATVLSWQESTGAASIQIDPEKLTTSLQADKTSLVLSSTQSMFLSAGTLGIGTSGTPPVGHGVTAGQVCALIEGFMTALGAALNLIGPTPLTGTSLGALLAPAPAADTLMAAGVELAAVMPLPLSIPALLLALQTPTDPTGTIPGVGRVGLML